MNASRIILTTICCLALVTVTFAGTGPSGSRWTGEDQGCSLGNHNWSDADNWTNCATCPPTSGDVVVDGDKVCDPCESCSCVIESCNPICEGTCSGGPNDGQSCSTTLDCDCCSGGSFVVDYDYTQSGTNTFGDVWILAASDADVTLRKEDDDAIFVTTGTLTLEGDGTKKAILDVDANGLRPDTLVACGLVDITGGSFTLNVDSLLQAGSTYCSDDTNLVIKDGVTVERYDPQQQLIAVDTTVRAANSKAATLTVQQGTLKIDDLEILGREDANKKATFLHATSNASVQGPSKITMQGHSLLDVDRGTNYSVSRLTVSTNGCVTDAKIEMASGTDTLTATNIDITSGSTSTHHATLTPNQGDLTCTGEVILTGDASGSKATLVIPTTTGVDVTLDDVILNAGGVLDVNITFSITGTLDIRGGTADLDIFSNRTLTADTIKLSGGASGMSFTSGFLSGVEVRTDSVP